MKRHYIPDTWLEQPQPNPGPAVAFRLGLPMAVIDRHGATHVVRDLETYNRITEGEAA